MSFSVYTIEDVLGTERDETTGTLLAQLGDVQGEQATSQAAEIWQPNGFASRPAAPTAGKAAAQAVVLQSGGRDVCVAMRDIRAQAMYGSLEAGDTAVYATDGMARALFKADGSVTLLTTTDNTDTGTTVSLRISGDGFVFSAPWGGFAFTAEGFQAFTQSNSTPPVFGGSLELKTDGTCAVTGSMTAINTSQVTLGIGATAVTGVCYVGSPVTPSTSVFVAP
jgi:hypothetical protein